MQDAFLRRGLKLRHLQMLDMLRETGHLGLAAERLGIAQPAASRLLAEVEVVAGAPVHERQGRGTGLTEVGLALARRASRVLIELRDAEREVAGIAAGTQGHVRIGSVTGPAMDRVLPALRNARLALPDVTTEVVVAPSDQLVAQLLAGRLDFAIGRIPPGIDAGLLTIRMLETEPVVLVVRRGHRLDRAAPIEAAELMEFDWVMPGQEAILGRTVLSRLTELGLPSPPRRVSTSSFLLTLAMVLQSNAIAPIAHAAALPFAKGPTAPLVILPVSLGIEVEPFGLITRTGSALPEVVGRLITLVTSPPAPQTDAT